MSYIMPDRGSGDPLYPQAVALIRKIRRPSISYVQRHLQIGYNRAADMVEAMVGTVLTSHDPEKGKLIDADGEAEYASWSIPVGVQPTPFFCEKDCNRRPRCTSQCKPCAEAEAPDTDGVAQGSQAVDGGVT